MIGALVPGSGRAVASIRGHRALVRHAGNSRPEDGLARAMGRCRKGPSLAQHHRASDRGAGRLGARRRASSRRKIRRAAASWCGSRPTARSTGRWRTISFPPIPTAPTATTTNTSTMRKTYHQVNKDTSIGVEFAGNYPDVTRGATEAQIAAWRILVKVLRARYRHSARPRLCAQLDRLQGCALLRRLRAGDAGAGVGGVADPIPCRPGDPSPPRLRRAQVQHNVGPLFVA